MQVGILDYSKWDKLSSFSEDEMSDSDVFAAVAAAAPFGEICYIPSHDAQVQPLEADGRRRDIKVLKQNLIKAKSLIDKAQWQELHDRYCVDGYSEPEVLRLLVCDDGNMEKLAKIISNPSNPRHLCAVTIVRACASWSGEMSCLLYTSDAADE